LQSTLSRQSQQFQKIQMRISSMKNGPKNKMKFKSNTSLMLKISRRQIKQRRLMFLRLVKMLTNKQRICFHSKKVKIFRKQMWLRMKADIKKVLANKKTPLFNLTFNNLDNKRQTYLLQIRVLQIIKTRKNRLLWNSKPKKLTKRK